MTPSAPAIALPKNDPREVHAWTMYDWANSVYSLVIATATFPIYFMAVAPDQIEFMGVLMRKESLYSYAISFAYAVVLLFGPILGGVADARGLKKPLLMLFCYTGAASCLAMFWFTPSTVHLGVWLLMAAGSSWALADTFYNSFLPDIATEDRFDAVSARGYSLGYIGSVLLLIVCLALVLGHETFGLDEGLATRIGFVLTGLWWGGFGTWVFTRLRNRPADPAYASTTQSALTRGFQELAQCLREFRHLPALGWFLGTFLLYNMTVQTVMYVATLFGKGELHLETSELITVLLAIQLVAIPGSLLFARISERRGNIFALRIIVFIWMLIVVAAYFVGSAAQFYLLAAVVGFVMGGVQSTSRATYTKLIPTSHSATASFFAFYSATDRLAIILGTLAFGAMNQLTGSMRTSILLMMLCSIAGLVLLLVLPWRRYAGSTAGIVSGYAN
jgi:MFS transporter, UMF1 family